MAGATGQSLTTPVTATFSEAVDLSSVAFTLQDSAGNPVAASLTWDSGESDGTGSSTAIVTPHSPLASLTTYTATVSGAKDLAGNLMAASVSWSFTTAVGGTITGASLWGGNATPATAAANDSNAQELGVKFSSELSGYITSIRFYKGPGNVGAHVTHLWTSSGTLLGTGAFTAESGSGWQQADFAQPIFIQANTTYVASYSAPVGHYAFTGLYFASSGVDSGALHVPSGPSGLFGAVGAFPTNSYNASNYWVDVVFSNLLKPTIITKTPDDNASGVSLNSSIAATFSEALTAATVSDSTFYLRPVGSSTSVAATVTYSGLTATLQPSAPLSLSTTYQVTAAGTITDTYGNAIGKNVTWSFTTIPNAILGDTTAADFAAGAQFTNAAIVQTSDGEVVLASTSDAEFAGATLPSAWTSSPWFSGGTATVASGVMTVDGTNVSTTAVFGPGRSLEFVANFSGDAYQHAGLVGAGFIVPWAMFSTGSGGNLYARTNAGSPIDTPLGSNWLGSAHDFRIDWAASSVTYSIDGTVVATHFVAIAGAMTQMASDYGVGGGSLVVYWMRLSPYAASGGFVSRVFDAGAAVTWLDALWSSTAPAGTSVAVSVRMGNTPTPDATWTDFIPLASSGAAVGGTSRYAQYRADLATSNTALTPSLQYVRLEYTTSADTVAPRAWGQSPAANATGVSLTAPVVVRFSELMNPATITAATISLRAAGATSDVAATVTFAGSTATLQPSMPLAGNNTYQVTIAGGVTDAAGNSVGSAVTWSFVTGMGQWQQTSSADFNSGMTSGTSVGITGGGAIQLAATTSDDFTGASLNAAIWTATPTGGGQANNTVTGGILTVGAVEVASIQTYSGVPIQGLVSFGATPYQHFGLATSLNAVAGNYWAIFSTASTTNTLFARVNVNGATQDVSLGALPAGFHDYVIKPVAGGFQFLVDGVLKTTVSATFPNGTALKIILSDYLGQAPLQADWLMIPTYVTTGTFTSAVFDAGRVASWGAANWNATAPAGTTVVVETSSSNDGTNWAAWSAVSNGGTVASPAGRYLRYRVTLTTTDPTVTPTFLDITLNWS